MTRRFPIFLAASLLQLGGVSSVSAERIAHHPWLAFGHHHKHHAVSARKRSEVDVSETKESRSRVASTKMTRNSSTGNRIANDALKYQGTPYVFGGTTRKGIDCSGLVMKVYDDIKSWKLPHAASSLYQLGHPVKESDLKAGDLVFFKNTYKHGISHVGIYTGDNRFIHARNHRFGVTVSHLSDPYFQLHYAGARRLY